MYFMLRETKDNRKLYATNHKMRKLVLEKFSIKRGPAIQRFPFEEGDIKIIKY